MDKAAKRLKQLAFFTSYVIASAVSELYVLTMMSLIGYLTYYLAYRKAKTE